MARKVRTVHPQAGKGQVYTEHAAEARLFQSLDTDAKGYLYKKQILDALQQAGIHPQQFKPEFQQVKAFSDTEKIYFETFVCLVKENLTLIEKALRGGLIIPDFQRFCQVMDSIYEQTEQNKTGHVATYIPQLARMDPALFGFAVCTIDGQTYARGDAEVLFSAQSTCKTINYCLAQKEHGEAFVHRYIGKEPSGHKFDVLRLNKNNLPHNPFINAGAIMACSLIRRDLMPADKFDYVMQAWQDLAGDVKCGFNNAVYLSEKGTADRNFAIAHFMREKKAFPEDTNLSELLEFYFQCCSIELNSNNMAVVAATLANAGVCPLTQKVVFSPETVKNCLSLMYSCGLYDFSGEFAFTVGLPAKTGVSGALMLVVPNVLGMCIFSPALDQYGNSVRGVEFCKHMIDKYNFHNYDSLIQTANKEDPRRSGQEISISPITAMIWAASQGDLMEMQRLVAAGIDINSADYDGRTALHLAASEGQLPVVNYLLKRNVMVNPVDRFGGTPLANAKQANHKQIAQLLLENGAHADRTDIPVSYEPYNPLITGLLKGYHSLPNVYDEYITRDDHPRASLQYLSTAMRDIKKKDFFTLHEYAKQSFKDRGITFKIYSKDGSATDSIFPFDLLPRIVPVTEWKIIEAGLRQRLSALNAFIEDVYGDQKIFKDKKIPESLLHTSPGYVPELRGISPVGGIHTHIAGFDLIRNAEGQLHVLEDNLRVPSGVSYILENRITMKSLVPSWFKGLDIHEVDAYPAKLLASLQSMVAGKVDDPLVVVLTPGPFNAAWFEHKYLAARMNCPLVENHDLVVEKNQLYWLSKTGKRQVHVVYRRTDDAFMDPDFFRKDSLLGIPGIVESYKSGQVVLANALGNGIGDDKAFYHYVPEMIQYYLGETIILPQIMTYIGANARHKSYILANLEKLVVKKVNQSGGYGMLIGPQASQKELAHFKAQIKESPHTFVAQPLIELSTIPTLNQRELRPHRVDLRIFALQGLQERWIMPGGLTRVALKEESYVVNSSQGGGSKDTWIMR